MDAHELLRNWPLWSKANAARVLASPAWRLETRFGEKPARLVRVEALDASATVVLDVRLDDEPNLLALEPTPLFPDLFLLKDRLAALPKEVLLALVEKECGVLFQFVEDIAKRRLSIAGLSDVSAHECGGSGTPRPTAVSAHECGGSGTPRPTDASAHECGGSGTPRPTAASAPATAFAVSGEAGEARFALDLTSEMEQRLGILANLDVTHPAIRELTREAVACHGAWTLPDDALSALAVGDRLVPDEGFAPQWLIEEPTDDLARAVSDEKGTLSFAQLADDALPSVPEPTKLTLVRRGHPLAALEPVRLGAVSAFRVCQRVDA